MVTAAVPRPVRADNTREEMTKRARILAFGSAGIFVLAGVAGAVIIDGTLGQAIALGLISIGLVLATSLVFLEVGLSEDRERAREEARERGPTAQRRTVRPRPRLGRMRGRPRRLR
jgi:hypothetical protein